MRYPASRRRAPCRNSTRRRRRRASWPPSSRRGPEMAPWTRQALEVLSERDACALVTVVGVQGSAPVQTGTKMLVWEGGQRGTIGGGNLEWTVADQARKLVAQTAR